MDGGCAMAVWRGPLEMLPGVWESVRVRVYVRACRLVQIHCVQNDKIYIRIYFGARILSKERPSFQDMQFTC